MTILEADLPDVEALADVTGRIADLTFTTVPRTLRATIVDAIGNDLQLQTDDGHCVIATADSIDQVVVYGPDAAAPPPQPPSDLADLLTSETGCARCGVDDLGGPIARSAALLITPTGHGIGLCAHHARRHTPAATNDGACVLYVTRPTITDTRHTPR